MQMTILFLIGFFLGNPIFHRLFAEDLISKFLKHPVVSSQNPSLCLSTVDPKKDYFPDKIQIQQAQGFRVTYGPTYKLVEVSETGRFDTKQLRPHRYLLLQCGTKRPQGFEDALVISIPVRSVVVTSTTHLPWILMLDEMASIRGIADSKYVNSETIRKRLDSGKIIEVIRGSSINSEIILSLKTDLLVSSGSGNQKN